MKNNSFEKKNSYGLWSKVLTSDPGLQLTYCLTGKNSLNIQLLFLHLQNFNIWLVWGEYVDKFLVSEVL